MQTISLFDLEDHYPLSLQSLKAPAYARSFEEKINNVKNSIRALLSRGYVLSIPVSYGKDSSVMLNIALEAMKEQLKENGSCPEAVVVTSNTLVENPVMDIFARKEARKVREYVKKNNLPVTVEIVEPNLSNNYLVNLIGGRTIAVDVANNSKCSEMMKVSPISKFKNKMLKKYGEYKVVTCVGKRYDESAVRAKNMAERKESPWKPVLNERNELVMSPVAEFTLTDIFKYIAEVGKGNIECYSNFKELLEVYRSANEGNCAVTVYATGKASKAACGSRTGCWICLRVSDDKSMESMLKEDKFSFMKPLNDLREYIKQEQYNPNKRNWLSRTVKNGMVKIAPNAYSPDHCETLLRMALSIDELESARSRKLNIAPRFKLITLDMLVFIECMWGRYGYQDSGKAIKIWDEVVNQGDYLFPGELINPDSDWSVKNIKRTAVSVPFADTDYDSIYGGLRDISLGVTGSENLVAKNGTLYANVNTEDEITVHSEGVEMFMAFELDNFLENYCKANIAPTEAYHYFMRLGTVSINKGGHSENDRMLRMANQIHRSGIRPYLNKPSQLIETLNDQFSKRTRQCA